MEADVRARRQTQMHLPPHTPRGLYSNRHSNRRGSLATPRAVALALINPPRGCTTTAVLVLRGGLISTTHNQKVKQIDFSLAGKKPRLLPALIGVSGAEN